MQKLTNEFNYCLNSELIINFIYNRLILKAKILSILFKYKFIYLFLLKMGNNTSFNGVCTRNPLD